MAPISKLFGSPGGAARAEAGLNKSGNAARRTPGPPRVIPKLGPALAASATTVNVEFSGAGLGRAVTSSTTIVAPTPTRPAVQGNGGETGIPTVASPGVMGILAGAPRAPTPGREPWVVVPVPKAPRRMPSSAALLSPNSLRPNRGGRNNPNRLSRNVDAVIDVETRPHGEGEEDEPDYLGPLLQRTLRRRGLSDSSIHSTFSSQEEAAAPSAVTGTLGNGMAISPSESAWLEKGSVLQALTRRVQNFRLGASASGSEAGTSLPQASVLDNRDRGQRPTMSSSSSTGFRILPTLSSWAAAAEEMTVAQPPPFLSGSVRDEGGLLERTRRQEDVYGLGGRDRR